MACLNQPPICLSVGVVLKLLALYCQVSVQATCDICYTVYFCLDIVGTPNRMIQSGCFRCYVKHTPTLPVLVFIIVLLGWFTVGHVCVVASFVVMNFELARSLPTVGPHKSFHKCGQPNDVVTSYTAIAPCTFGIRAQSGAHTHFVSCMHQGWTYDLY